MNWLHDVYERVTSFVPDTIRRVVTAVTQPIADLLTTRRLRPQDVLVGPVELPGERQLYVEKPSSTGTRPRVMIKGSGRLQELRRTDVPSDPATARSAYDDTRQGAGELRTAMGRAGSGRRRGRRPAVGNLGQGGGCSVAAVLARVAGLRGSGRRGNRTKGVANTRRQESHRKSGRVTASAGDVRRDLVRLAGFLDVCAVGGGQGGGSSPAAGACFVANTPVLDSAGCLAIAHVQIGDRVTTFAPGDKGGYVVEERTIDPQTWKVLRAVIEYENGNAVEVELLRSPEWFALHDAKVGGRVLLDMPEMGVAGEAVVEAVEPCPAIGAGPGRIVTGTFKHRFGVVYDLKVAGDEKPIGTTPTHPFWSVDRERWIAAIDLQIGERLKTLDGFTTVEGIEKRPEPEPVYNIEVEGDHVYRVGESGVLVHNTSASLPAPDSGWTPPSSNWRGPGSSWGCFIGNRGDSDFTVDPSRYTRLGLSASDNVVPFRRGKAIFTKWAQETFSVPGLTGDPSTDRDIVAEYIAKREGFCRPDGTPIISRGQEWLDQRGLTAHHAGGCTIELVPTEINRLPHTGGAAEIRNGSVNCRSRFEMSPLLRVRDEPNRVAKRGGVVCVTRRPFCLRGDGRGRICLSV